MGFAFSQNGTLRGTVIDAETQANIPDARALVVELNRSAIANEHGVFVCELA